MSTPIQQLQNAAPPATAEVPQDPEVLNVLSEMEQEVAAASRSHAAPQPTPVASMPHPPVPPPMRPAPVIPPVKPRSGGLKSLYNPELVQKTAILTLVALVLFYPSTMHFIYAKAPQYEAMLKTYDIFIRCTVFAVVVYVLFLKFNV